MSLIGGYITKAGPVDTQAVRRTVEAFNPLPSSPNKGYEVRFVEGTLGCIFAKYRPDVQSFTSCTTDIRGNTLVMLGYADLPGTEMNPGSAGLADLSILPERLETTSGEFLAAFCDPAMSNVHLVNDRFGARACHIIETQQVFVFCSNVGLLLDLPGVPRRPDPTGMIQLFAYRRIGPNRTLFEGVERLAPASHLVLSRNGAAHRQYWQVRYEPNHNLEPVRHAHEVFAAFRQGIIARRRTMQSGFLTLSGGLDSRLMATALAPDASLPAFTITDADDSSATYEVQGAVQIARALGLTHEIRRIPVGEVSGSADDLVMLTGGSRPLNHSIRSLQYARLGLTSHLGGSPGDEISGDWVTCMRDLDPRQADESLQRFISGLAVFGRQHLALFFRDDILEALSAQTGADFCGHLLSAAGPTSAHRICAAMIRGLWPGTTFSNAYNNHPFATQIRPHLHYPFVDMMLRLPASWLYKRSFYKFMIYHCAPQLRGVRNARTGELLDGRLLPANLTPSFFARDFLRTKARGAWLKAMRLSGLRRLFPFRTDPNTGAITQGRHDYHLFKNDPQLFENLREILASYPVIAEVLDRDRCRAFLDDFQQGRLHHRHLDAEVNLLGSLTSVLYVYKKLIARQ